MKDLLVAACLLTGVGLMITAVIGLLRLPDLFCRAHAVAKASALGIFLLLIGMWIALAEQVNGLKLLLAIVFQVLTIPVSSHLTGMLARESGVPRWRGKPRQEKPADGATG